MLLPAIGDEDEEQEESSPPAPVTTTATASTASKTERKSAGEATPTTTSTTSFNGHKYFGIKSYLHKFYENATCNASDLEDFEDDRYVELMLKLLRINSLLSS